MNQDSVLRYLERCNKLVTTEEISKKININQTTVSTNMRRLFVQGVVYYECYINKERGNKEIRFYGLVNNNYDKTKRLSKELRKKVNSLRRFK